ncbi:MAG: 1-acyl-sn-glycerol-3-phosphate acyltransferase [Muribaculaceae bacterium]|nr:1-acyl-sn-glycerol-3-phosphate acyltransferase [Muribaculaceae bacterium]
MRSVLSFLWKIYLIFIAGPLFIVATFITAVLTIITTAIGGKRFWGYWPAHIWSRLVCFLACVRVEVRNRDLIDKNESYVFVCNHQGAFDIWAIFGYLNHNFRWLMKKSLEKIIFVGYACRRSGHIFVDHSSLQSIKTTIEDARDQLKGGMSLVIFPEGTRSADGSLGSFKRGAFMLAGEFGLPVVPLSIQGAYEIMPKDAKFPRPGKIILTIHEPIRSETGSYNTRELLSQCYDIIKGDLEPEIKGNLEPAALEDSEKD